MSKCTRRVLALLAIALAAGGYFGWKRYKEEQAKPAVWWEFTSEVVLVAKDMMVSPGSWAIHVNKKTKFSVYLIDNGEKTLKDSFVIDPAYLNELFVTATLDNSGEGMLLFKPTHKKSGRKNPPLEMWRSRWVNFPKPFRMGYNASGGESYPDPGVPGEKILFHIYVRETRESAGIIRERINDMLDESKKDPMSYLVITCSDG